ALLVCASTYWRNAWKYRARAYRHCFWDTGTILANLLAIAAADAVPAKLVLGFVDQCASDLLALDAQREGPLALVSLGHQPDAVLPAPTALEALQYETVPLSEHE